MLFASIVLLGSVGVIFLKMLFASIVLLGSVGVIFLPLFVALLGLRLLWETFSPPFPIMLSSKHLLRLHLWGVLDSQLLDELVCPLLPAILSADIRNGRSFHRSLVSAHQTITMYVEVSPVQSF